MINGVINFYKEAGITSFQAVDRVKKLLKIKKLGHTGTLDPIAEGILPICLNNTTKFVDYLMANDKEYIAEIKLGLKTDSYDITGKIIAKNEDIIPNEQNLLFEMNKFIGETELPVPSYSAVKINGKRAHELARKGLIENAGTRINIIYSIDLIEYNYPTAIIKVNCAKGTYIRSIIHVLGENLKCFATMTGLVRTRNGKFHIKNSYKLANIEEMIKKNNYDFIKTIEECLDWPKAIIKPEAEKLVLNGISPKKYFYTNLPIEINDMFFITNQQGKLLAFAKKNKNSPIPLKLLKVFN
jgi:tRNA pseudouridine55 synthase